MKTIYLSRPKEQINVSFSYSILIDGKQVSELENGDTIELQVPENAEVLTTKLKWCGSPSFALSEIEDGATVRVEGNTLLNRTLPLLSLAILFIAPLFADGSVMKILMTSVIVFAILSLVATLTVGRNKWLNVESV